MQVVDESQLALGIRQGEELEQLGSLGQFIDHGILELGLLTPELHDKRNAAQNVVDHIFHVKLVELECKGIIFT